MVILGLGSNIGDRLANLRLALNYLKKTSGIKIAEVSPVYESQALLPKNAAQAWNFPYLNLAIACETKLNPRQLLEKIKKIEVTMGRVDYLKWSPRIIDIDILTWNDEFYELEGLTIPHEELLERPFAMWPLSDIAPDWKYCAPRSIATGKTAKEIVKKWGSRFNATTAPFGTHQINHRVDTPVMVGTLNVTPDSFSDGGMYDNLAKALEHANNLFLAGADVIDSGAESTRPGNKNASITPEEEWSRLRPILQNLTTLWEKSSFKPKISVDTRNPDTALKVLEYKIDFLNDVTGFTKPKMCEVARNSDVQLIFMHNLGVPASHKDNILNESQDVTEQVYEWAEKQIQKLTDFGIKQERLIFDVGIGFGKSQDQSFSLIQNIAKFKKLKVPIFVGHSRKSFLNKFTNKPFHERDLETAIISNFLASQKVDYLRVHDIELNMRAMKVAAALRLV